MTHKLSVPIFWVLFSLVTLVGVSAQAVECPELVERALKAVANVCNTLGRNEACYGNDHLETELESSSAFTKPADRIPLGDIRAIRTFGLNEQDGTWGIAVLNVQANLPDTLPGQAVKFILYGDVAIQNASENGISELSPMQAFYFTTNMVKPNCKEAPTSSLVIQSPKGYRVNLTVNGMALNVGSSVALTAQRNGRMIITTMEGRVYAFLNDKQMMIPQGFETSVQLGGEDGLVSQAVPEVAYLIDNSEWQSLANATDGIMEDAIDLLDTSQWKTRADYCADTANDEVCADPAFGSQMIFENCPPDVCPLLTEETQLDTNMICVDANCGRNEAVTEQATGIPVPIEPPPSNNDSSNDDSSDDDSSGDDSTDDDSSGDDD